MIRVEIKNKPHSKTYDPRLCITIDGCEDCDKLYEILSHISTWSGSSGKNPQGVVDISISTVWLGIRIFHLNWWMAYTLFEFSTDKDPQATYNRSMAKMTKRFPHLVAATKEKE